MQYRDVLDLLEETEFTRSTNLQVLIFNLPSGYVALLGLIGL